MHDLSKMFAKRLGEDNYKSIFSFLQGKTTFKDLGKNSQNVLNGLPDCSMSLIMWTVNIDIFYSTVDIFIGPHGVPIDILNRVDILIGSIFLMGRYF